MCHHMLLDNPKSIIVWQFIYNNTRYNDPKSTLLYLNWKVRSCVLVLQVLILLVNSYQAVSSMNFTLHNEINCLLARPCLRHVACAVCLSKYCLALVIVCIKTSCLLL